MGVPLDHVRAEVLLVVLESINPIRPPADRSFVLIISGALINKILFKIEYIKFR